MTKGKQQKRRKKNKENALSRYFLLSPLSSFFFSLPPSSVIFVPSNNAKHFSNSSNIYRMFAVPNIQSIQISLIGKVFVFNLITELFGRYDRSNISISSSSVAVVSCTLNERMDVQPGLVKKLLLHSLSLLSPPISGSRRFLERRCEYS